MPGHDISPLIRSDFNPLWYHLLSSSPLSSPQPSSTNILCFSILFCSALLYSHPGKVSFVSQSAWIQNASLRANILFGLEYEDGTYTPSRFELHFNRLKAIPTAVLLHTTKQQFTTLDYTPAHYTILHYTTLNYNTINYTTLHYKKLHCATLHYTPAHYITLHHTTLQYTLSFPIEMYMSVQKNTRL